MSLQESEAVIISAHQLGKSALRTAIMRDRFGVAELPQACPRSVLGQLGVVFGPDSDDLFVQVVLPQGWGIAPRSATDERNYELLDAQGRARAHIYMQPDGPNRCAFMVMLRRYEVKLYGGAPPVKDDWANPMRWEAVIDRISGDILLAAQAYNIRSFGYRKAAQENEAALAGWLDERYPRWREPLAYWNELATG